MQPWLRRTKLAVHGGRIAPEHHHDEQFGLSIFPDPVLAVALPDRLLHHATNLGIRGDSYRLETRRGIGPPTSNAEANMTNTTKNDHIQIADRVQNQVAAGTTLRHA